MRRLGIAAMALATAFLGVACSAHRPPAHVPVESRPTPPQPPPPTAGSTAPQSIEPPKPAITQMQANALMARAVVDTNATREALTRCAGRKLLPDQEGIYDSAVKLLDQARAAFLTGDIVEAASHARRARQTAAALDCR